MSYQFGDSRIDDDLTLLKRWKRCYVPQEILPIKSTSS